MPDFDFKNNIKLLTGNDMLQKTQYKTTSQQVKRAIEYIVSTLTKTQQPSWRTKNCT